ncbi:alpha/beta hydrolase [Ideonella sp.]|uniref:alpha/beta hydrolase n=1 Tax=Ideonella sp. TaxID=1929293 RepID=UPI002B46246F|nr:alpha/beta fold hydrolase [Ideonella sp.]HJV68123.1 alpha/beta fold hydrolase [Ideonella sp.]
MAPSADARHRAPGAVPITFGEAETRCFGWYHSPSAPARATGVVLCRPVGYEGTCAYETFTQLAERLADDGFAVIRFDYHGTGDSIGSDADPDRVAAWQACIVAALDEVARLAGSSRLALFGVRIGATLAAQVAARRGGVDSVVWWAPCPTGRAFVRELRAAGTLRAHAPSPEGPSGDDLETLGTLYTAQTLQDLQALDARPGAARPARRALFIGRDDLPGAGPLPAAYREAGIETTVVEWPGYAAMMAEPHEADVPRETIDGIVGWLRAGEPAERGFVPGASSRIEPPMQRDAVFGGVRERPLLFGHDHGDRHSLFGILAEPADLAQAGGRSETAILMLNVGTNHRVGPNRLYVKMARAWAERGYRSLRFDLAGIGDSRTAAGYAQNRLYSKGSTVDVGAAIERLSGLGVRRFILVGLCSGAYVAFQTALADPRVTGLVLINPRRLDWGEGETLQSAMQRSYKSSHYYRRALLQPATYRRLFAGDIDVRGIAGRLATLTRVRAERATRRLLGRAPAEENVLANMRLLSERGTDILLIVAETDDGLDYLEYHIGPRGRHMRGQPNFRMLMVAGADHTLSQTDSQQHVIEAVREHLDHTS